jgi:hypothetical protein
MNRNEGHMTILDDLLGVLTQDAPVRTVLVGSHWTVVCSQSCGLAATMRADQPHGPIGCDGAAARKKHWSWQYARSNQPLESASASRRGPDQVDESRTAQINAVVVLMNTAG